MQQIIKLFTGHLTGKLLFFLIHIWLGYSTEIAEYGRFSYLLAIGAIFLQPVFDHGSDMIWTKQVSLSGAFPIKQLFKTKAYALLASIFLTYIGYIYLDLSFIEIGSCFTYYYILSWQTAFFAFLRGNKKPQHEGYALVLTRSFAFTALIHINRTSSLSVSSIFLIFSLMPMIGAIYCIVVGKFHERASSAVSIQHIMLESRPLFFNQILWAAYNKVDLIVLKAVIGEIQVGYYHLSTKFLEAAFLLPNIVLIFIFPNTVNSLQDRENWTDYFFKYLKKIVLMSFLIALASFFALFAIYKQTFVTLPIHKEVILFATLLTPLLLPLSVNKYFSDCFIGLHIQKKIFFISSLSLAVNLALNLVLVQLYSVYGIIAAKFISEVLMSILFSTSLFFYAKDRKPLKVIVP